MEMMRYFQAWERCSCKEAQHDNTESNWTDACSVVVSANSAKVFFVCHEVR